MISCISGYIYNLWPIIHAPLLCLRKKHHTVLFVSFPLLIQHYIVSSRQREYKKRHVVFIIIWHLNICKEEERSKKTQSQKAALLFSVPLVAPPDLPPPHRWITINYYYYCKLSVHELHYARQTPTNLFSLERHHYNPLVSCEVIVFPGREREEIV